MKSVTSAAQLAEFFECVGIVAREGDFDFSFKYLMDF